MSEYTLPFGLPGLVDASPQSLGWVYVGNEPMSNEDKQMLNDWMMSMGYPGDQKIDPFSIRGKYNSKYTTYGNLVEGTQAQGGLGSPTYEQQWVDPDTSENGVSFVKPGDTIWYIDSETGEALKGFPPDCGAYHEVNVGGGYSDYYSGPKPGSVAEEILGDGTYFFSPLFRWYEVK